jgi:hypothetical protein
MRTIDVSIIWTAASWAAASAFMMRLPTPACRQRTTDYSRWYNAGWDRDLLARELQGLIDFGFEIELTGISLAEVDLVLEEAQAASPASNSDADDDVPVVSDPLRP